MTELEFIKQARWFGERKGYKSSWVWVIFRERYGKWPGKFLKEGEPQEASEEFIDWLLAYWASKKPDRTAAGTQKEQPPVTPLDDGYRAMAADKARESEAMEWCNALAGEPSARLVPLAPANVATRKPDRLAGKPLSDAFFEPLPPE